VFDASKNHRFPPPLTVDLTAIAHQLIFAHSDAHPVKNIRVGM